MGVPFPVAELVRALRAEITSDLRSDGGNSPILTLRGGALAGRNGTAYEYDFRTRTERNPLAGTAVLLRRGSTGNWTRGEISWSGNGQVRLTTETSFGRQIDELRVRDDETAGLLKLIEKLEQVGETGRSPVDLGRAGWMLGKGRPATGRVGNPEELVRGYRELRLNAFQRLAVEQALGSEVTFVWGPPGTGKTEVVSRIVEGCHRQGHTVLFVAPTNVAVDQALERICQLLAEEDGFGAGLVQRSGTVTVASLEKRFGEFIVPERIAERLSENLNRQRADVNSRLEHARRDLAVHEEAVRLAEECRRLRELAGRTLQEARRTDAELQQTRMAIERDRQEADSIGVPGGLFAQRKRQRLEELNRRIAGCQADEARLNQRAETLRRQQLAVSRQSADLEPRLREMERAVTGVPPYPAVKEAADRLAEEQRRIDGELSKIGDAVRGNCRVMGTTVAKAVQSRRLMETTDVVVIDEAGMVNLPSAWYAAGLARERVVVAGDFRQLPAVTKGSGDREASPQEREHSRQWMDRDVFHAAGLVDGSGSVRRDGRLVALSEQYRMRPAICAVVNEVAYPDAPLRTGRDDLSDLPPSPLLESPLVLVDTSAQREALTPRPVRGGHKTNTVHEAVIHELIRGLQADTVLPTYQGREEGVPTDRLAVIAPYRDQVALLQRSITQRFGTRFDGLVDTVHRFQGSQRPVVIIDTVAGASDRAGYFYEGLGLSSHTCRLLNVALSRAQHHLVVVADVEFLSRTLPPSSETRLLVDHLLRHAQRLPVQELVPVRMASDLARLPDHELVRPAFFPKDEVPRAVAWDIARAARSIEIYCAFLDPAPVDHWLERLRGPLSNGIKVVVHTRDQEAKNKTHLITRLRQAGCEVDIRPAMHEKVMIVDDEILWHGSLNLLANSGPTDLMMRLTSRASCARVKQIVTRARSERPASLVPRTTGNPPPRPRTKARPNRFPGHCAGCSIEVPAESGTLTQENGKWIVRCPDCTGTAD